MGKNNYNVRNAREYIEGGIKLTGGEKSPAILKSSLRKASQNEVTSKFTPE